MKDLVEFMVKVLVDKPEEVNISENSGNGAEMIEIRVAADDVGKVIGREGRIANALRTIAKAAAFKQGKKVNVEIITEDVLNFNTKEE